MALDAVAPLPLRKSLRAKGFLTTLVLLVYLLASVLYVASERGRIYESVQALQQLSRHEKAVALAEAAVNGALVDVNVASNAASPEPALPTEITLYMENSGKLFGTLDEFDPAYALLQRAVARSYAELQAAPTRASWIALRESLGRASDDLEIRRRSLIEQRDELSAAYQRHYDAVTVKSLLLSLLGIAAGGFCALRFGYFRTLVAGVILQSLVIAAFAILAWTGPSLTTFGAVMAVDSFGVSFAGVALVTYMSSLTSLGYTATQYALLSSAYAYVGKFAKGFSGVIVEHLAAGRTLMDGYALFFIGCGLIGLPAFVLCLVLARRVGRTAPPAG